MFQVFLFCESAMIALWHGKQVETAFFSKYIQLCTKRWRGVVCSPQKYCHHILTSPRRWLRWFWSKRGESLNQASYQLLVGWPGNKQLRPPRREKSKLLSYNCYFADRSPNTAAGWEPTKEDSVAQKVFGLPAKPMSLRPSNTTTVFLVPQCLLMILSLEHKILNLYWSVGISWCFLKTQLQIFCCNFSVRLKSIFLVVVLKGPKEMVTASVQECLDKKGKNDPSNSDSYENLSVCDQTCPP